MRSLLSNFYKKCAFLIKDNVTCGLTIIWQKSHLLWVRNYTDSVSKFIELNTSRNLELKLSIWREPSKRDSVMRFSTLFCLKKCTWTPYKQAKTAKFFVCPRSRWLRRHDTYYGGTSTVNFGSLSLTFKEQSSKKSTWVCLLIK